MTDVLIQKKIDLDQKLSPEQSNLLRKIANVAADRQVPLYIVGGFVRDLLLGDIAKDFDLVVEGDAVSLARALVLQYGGRITAHVRFGTAQWFLPGPGQRALDLISTRTESYKHPAALPTVKPGRLMNDLLRRDFSINTLALRIDGEHWGELHDELGGLEDLKRGLVRVLHPGSFQDDPTRLFRAVRYEQRYGFQISPETLSLMSRAYPLINMLSAERLRHELDLVLEEGKVAAILGRLAELDLLRPAHPVLPWNDLIKTRFIKGFLLLKEAAIKKKPSALDKGFLGWHFWLMDASTDDLQNLERRLHFRANLLDSLLAASILAKDLPNLTGLKPSQWVSRLEDLPLMAVFAVFLANPDGIAGQNFSNYLDTWRHVKPMTNGHDLTKRGLTPGPQYQRILRRLRDAWLDEEVKTEEEELVLLGKLI